MTQSSMKDLIEGIKSGQIVPYLGPGILSSVTNVDTGEAIPSDSDSLIIAMNGGKPMSARLMYEFPRAAMDLELKKGRSYVNRFLSQLYGETQWTRAALHDWLAEIQPAYVVDINRDTQLQDSYNTTAHNLILGTARLGGSDYRFRIYHYDGEKYSEIDQIDADTKLPVLFKPMGSPVPEAIYIASDADYVDYITELMGGFAIPDFLKQYRKDKQYLFMGMHMTRDTERMVLSDITYAAGQPKGWALIAEPTEKEQRFCKKQGVEIIKADVHDLLEATGIEFMADVNEEVKQVGC